MTKRRIAAAAGAVVLGAALFAAGLGIARTAHALPSSTVTTTGDATTAPETTTETTSPPPTTTATPGGARVGRALLVIEWFGTSPRVPRAGRRFAALATAITGDGKLIESGAVACTARAGTRTLAPMRRGFVGKKARCLWRIPRSARGKRLSGSIAITADHQTARARFAKRIR